METTSTVSSGLIDNRDQTTKSIAALILEKAPPGLRANDRKFLESIVNGQSSNWGTVEWERHEDTHRASASLYFTFDEGYSERFEDSEGNVWRQYNLVITTNWASYGGAHPAIQKKRLALMSEVTAFAQDILDFFPGPFHRLVKTAAQVKAEKEARESEETLNRVKHLVFTNRTKMRVGQERSLELYGNISFEGLPQAKWEVEMNDGKKYKFEKLGTHGAYLTRLS
jgi:hypothetical protein